MQVISSGNQTGNKLVKTGSGKFYGLIVSTDGSNAATINTYDGLTAAGNKLIPELLLSTDKIHVIEIPGDCVAFTTGLYVSVETNGTVNYCAYFE